MKFLDSNILAYAFYENDNRERCQNIIKEGGIINTVNLIEAYNIIQFEVDEIYAAASIKSLLKSNLKIINIDVNLVFEALKKSSKYKKLKFIDLIHYISALLQGCDEIASYDKDFDDLEIKRIT